MAGLAFQRIGAALGLKRTDHTREQLQQLRNRTRLIFGSDALREVKTLVDRECLEGVRAAIKNNPEDPNFYSDRGKAYAKSGFYAEAMEDFTKAVELDPKYVDAYNNRALTCYEQEKYDKAIMDFTKAIELDPKNENAHKFRDVSYERLRKKK